MGFRRPARACAFGDSGNSPSLILWGVREGLQDGYGAWDSCALRVWGVFSRWHALLLCFAHLTSLQSQ